MAPPAELVDVVPIWASNADTHTFYVKLFESDATIHHAEPVLRIDGHVHRIEKSLLPQRDKADGVAVLIGGLCGHLYLLFTRGTASATKRWPTRRYVY